MLDSRMGYSFCIIKTCYPPSAQIWYDFIVRGLQDVSGGRAATLDLMHSHSLGLCIGEMAGGGEMSVQSVPTEKSNLHDYRETTCTCYATSSPQVSIIQILPFEYKVLLWTFKFYLLLQKLSQTNFFVWDWYCHLIYVFLF